MGLIAAGALGGLGKGITENAEATRVAQAKELENAREQAIREYEAGQASQRQQTGFTHEESMAEKEKATRKELQSGQQTFESGQGEEERKFKGGEGEKERAKDIKVAEIQANARASAGGSKRGRWQSKSITTTTTTPDGLPVQNSSLALFDAKTGRSYMQNGDRFFPQGVESKSVRRAARSEITKLLKSPDQADNFLHTYNYLPIEFFSVIPSTTEGSEPSSGSEE